MTGRPLNPGVIDRVHFYMTGRPLNPGVIDRVHLYMTGRPLDPGVIDSSFGQTVRERQTNSATRFTAAAC